MYEDAQEIFEYLPIRRDAPENDYINHLWQTFSILDGGDAVVRPFAVMPFHLLFMLSSQYKMLQIASSHKQATDLFFTGVGGRNKKQLLSEQRSVFDMALINERTAPDIFQLVEVDPEVIKKFKELVDERNDNLAHAKGGIEQDLENKLAGYVAVLESIQKSCVQINQKLADEWILEVKVGDDMDQFLERRLLDSRVSPRDFGDIIGLFLEAERFDIDQWTQIVNKGLELAYDQTVIVLSLSKGFDQVKINKAFKILQDMNGKLKKQIGSMMYELDYFEGDGKYVISGADKESMLKGAVRVPEIAVFNEKESAMFFWKNLDTEESKKVVE